MRIGEVIGTVTLNRAHPTLVGGTLKLAVPLTLENLTGESSDRAEALVVYDALGAGLGNRIAISEGREAAQPFDPEGKPIDVYSAALLDRIDVVPLNP